MGKVDCHCNTACFGLSALYLPLPTHDPVRRPGITPPLYTKHVLIWSQFVQFSCCPLPFSYLCIFIYLCCLLTLKPVSLVENLETTVTSGKVANNNNDMNIKTTQTRKTSGKVANNNNDDMNLKTTQARKTVNP